MPCRYSIADVLELRAVVETGRVPMESARQEAGCWHTQEEARNDERKIPQTHHGRYSMYTRFISLGHSK